MATEDADTFVEYSVFFSVDSVANVLFTSVISLR